MARGAKPLPVPDPVSLRGGGEAARAMVLLLGAGTPLTREAELFARPPPFANTPFPASSVVSLRTWDALRLGVGGTRFAHLVTRIVTVAVTAARNAVTVRARTEPSTTNLRFAPAPSPSWERGVARSTPRPDWLPNAERGFRPGGQSRGASPVSVRGAKPLPVPDPRFLARKEESSARDGARRGHIAHA